jgi:hypothetical protein
MTPGLHDSIPEAAYHADRESLSVSGAKVLLRSPAKFRWLQDNPKVSDTFDFGHAAHRLVLGAGASILVCPFDSWRTKDAQQMKADAHAKGEIPLLTADYERVQAMADKLSEHTTAMRLLSDGKPEVSAYADDPETGVRMRCRYDWLGDGYGADYKSCADASPDGFARAVANFGYDAQDDWYRHVADLLGQPLGAFCFVAQEKEPPYIVEVYELDAGFLARGRERNERARRIFAECTATGDWSRGYTGLPYSTLYAPSWAMKDVPA